MTWSIPGQIGPKYAKSKYASHGVLQCHMRALQAFRALLIGLRLVLERPVQALRVLFNGI